MSRVRPGTHSSRVPAWSEWVDRIRVLLAELPRMLREIIESVIAGQHDMSIVGAVDTRDRVADALGLTPADVVIVGLRPGESTAALDAVLFEQPRLKLLAIRGD